MSFGKPRRRPVDEDQRILPLINVVFLLLIFFMVAGQLSKTDPVQIEPPVSDNDTAAENDPLQVFVTADGRVQLGADPVAVSELASRIRALPGDAARGRVHLKADGQADTALVLAALQEIRAAGAETVRLMTSTRKAP